MASLMETFEQQYATLYADITSKTSRLSDLSGGKLTSLLYQICWQNIHLIHAAMSVDCAL